MRCEEEFYMQTDTYTVPNGAEEANLPSVSPCRQTDDEAIDAAAARILEQYRPAFLELAK